MKITLKRADVSDFELVRSFEVELSEFERSLGVIDAKPQGHVQFYSDEQLKKFLTNEDVYFLIAQVDGVSVGGGFCQITQNVATWDKHERHGYIGLIYVREAYRKKGIASKVTSELTSWAKSKGVKELRLKVYTANKKAIKVYEKQGFTNLTTEMIKQL